MKALTFVIKVLVMKTYPCFILYISGSGLMRSAATSCHKVFVTFISC